MKTRSRNFYFIAATLFFLLITSPGIAKAGGLYATRTLIKVASISPVAIGEIAYVSAELSTPAGEPVDNQVVKLVMDDTLEFLTITDENGDADFTFRARFAAGKHDLAIIFPGNTQFSASQANAILEITPGVIKIYVIPAMEGIQFALNERVFKSNADGQAEVTVFYPGNYPIRLLNDRFETAQYYAEFKRWEPGVYNREHEFSFPDNSYLVIGFEQFFPVELVFEDLYGQKVDPGRISSVSLRNSQGEIQEIQIGQPLFLKKNRIVQRLKGLDEVDLLYTVQRVMVDGYNVVNQGSQRFKVVPGEPWHIRVLLYTVKFIAREVYIDTQVGEGVELKYSDGRIVRAPFGEDHQAVFQNLARGFYEARVYGARGLSVFTPIAVSRDQEVELIVYSYTTLLMIVFIPAVMAVILVFIGRPGVRSWLRKFINKLIFPRRARHTEVQK